MADPAGRFSGFGGDPIVRLGQLRWPVTVARRRQNFDPPGGVGINEDWVAIQVVHAEVIPSSGLTFWMTGGQEQVDTPITHRITTRWLGYLDNNYVIARNTRLPDGTMRGELFRLHRIKELGGRKRFTSIDAELERTYPDAISPPLPAGTALATDVGDQLLDDFGNPLLTS